LTLSTQCLIKARVAAGAPPLEGDELDLAIGEWAEVVCVIPRDQFASVYRYAKASRELKATGFPLTPDEVLHAYKVMCAPKFLSTADAWELAMTLAEAGREEAKRQALAKFEAEHNEKRREWDEAVARYKAGETDEIEGCWYGYSPDKEFDPAEYNDLKIFRRMESEEPPILSEHQPLQKVLRMYGWRNFFLYPYASEYQQRFVFDYKVEVEHALAAWADEFARNL
jgi:hypothetical protein